MKIQKTREIAVDFDNAVYTNVYVSEWSKVVEFKFLDQEGDGTEYKLNINLTIDKARKLSEELAADLASYDAEQAEKAAQKAEDEAYEKAESEATEE